VNPLFPGINPEPIVPHVALLQETVARKMPRRLVTDGECRSIALWLKTGSFVDSRQVHVAFCELAAAVQEWPAMWWRAFTPPA